MNNPLNPDLKEDLLKQMSAEIQDVHPGHRHELDDKLRFALTHERRSRSALLAALGLAIALWLSALLLQLDRPLTLPEPLLLAYLTALLLAPLAALLFAGLYFFKYRPRRKRVETQTDRVALEEMRREIDDLKRRLEQHAGGSK